MFLGYFGGMKVYESTDAIEKTDERLFPASKNRSKRIRKKLIKRFGGEFRMKPCILSNNRSAIWVHPALMTDFKHAIDIHNRQVGTSDLISGMSYRNL